jgi:Xaa-Pro aminopeptidase
MQSLHELCVRAQADACLITHLPNVRYLCGFTGSSAVLLTDKSPVLFTDGRYDVQARRETSGVRIVICRGSLWKSVSECVARQKQRRLAVESNAMSVATYRTLEGLLGTSVALQDAAMAVEQLRCVKDAEEIERIAAAVRLGDKLLAPLLRSLRPGAKEAEAAARLEFNARKAGAEGMSFETILAGGARSAMPHAHASSEPLPRRGFVVMDYGVRLDGYCSDMTRTVHLGKATAGEKDAYSAVLEAQLAAMDAIRPGATAGEVDQAARDALRRHKLARYFTHVTGHGVGLEIHEAPRIAAKQPLVLQPGMVITIEPGIYLPDRYGIRIEDMAVVTDTGARALTTARKALLEL